MGKDFSEVAGSVAKWGQGASNLVNAGTSVYSSFNPKSGGGGANLLTGGASTSLQGPGAMNLANLSQSLKGFTQGGGSGGGGSSGVSVAAKLPQVDRSHYDLLLKQLQAYRG